MHSHLLTPREDETLDVLFGGRLPLLQSRRGHRTSVDALALACFAHRLVTALHLPVASVRDLGAGTGLVSLLLGHAWPHAHLQLFEVQAQQADRAERNLQLHHLRGRAHVIVHDLAAPLDAAYGQVQLAVSNPPFRVATTQVPPQNTERRLAHFESTAALEVFADRLVASLDSQGLACLIYPWQDRQRAEFALQNKGMHVDTWPLLHRPSDPVPIRALVAASTLPLPRPTALALHRDGEPDSRFSQDIEDFIALLPQSQLEISPT